MNSRNTKTIEISFVGIAAIMALALTTLPVYAIGAHDAISSSTASDKATERLQKIITKADADIAVRITALNELDARVQTMKNVSSAQRTTFSAEVQTDTAGLTALKAKIDADTDPSTALADAKTIFTAFRIYALFIPQGWILASADRIATVAGLLTTISTHIQERISADQTAGKDVTTLTAVLADMNAKIADATTQSTSAQAGVSSLVPDQGDKATMIANHTALVTARATIKKATTDLEAARKDVTTLMQGLRVLEGNAPAATTTSTH